MKLFFDPFVRATRRFYPSSIFCIWRETWYLWWQRSVNREFQNRRGKIRDKDSREDFRSTWQDTRLKCARTDEIGILCRLEDDDDDDEVWKHGIRWAYIYVYIKIFLSQFYIPSIQCKFCMYNIFSYYYKFFILLQIQNKHSPPRIRKIYIIYIKKDKI